ncbi:MAG: DUF58 domain-containing protein [Candidatus Methylomirabilales bacterium]
MIRPTREGLWFLAATLAVGLAATNTGNNLLYLILAMLLALLVISGLLSEQTMRRVGLRRELPRRVFAGLPATLRVTLQNGKARAASYGLQVSEADPGGGPAARHFVLRLPAQARERWQYRLTFPRRGRQALPGLVLWTRFPFGLFEKIGRPAHRDPVLVYPRVRALRPGEIPAILQPGWRERDRRGQGASLYNLRPYRPGDDPRLIHWRTSARMGDLMLKELAEEDRPRVCLLLHDPAPGSLAERVEADLSLAASLAAWAVRSGLAVELITADGPTGQGDDEAHLDRILTRLALYEAPPAPRPLPAPPAGGRAVRVALGAGRGAEAAG